MNIIKSFIIYKLFDIELLIFLFICRKLKFEDDVLYLNEIIYLV